MSRKYTRIKDQECYICGGTASMAKTGWNIIGDCKYCGRYWLSIPECGWDLDQKNDETKPLLALHLHNNKVPDKCQEINLYILHEIFGLLKG